MSHKIHASSVARHRAYRERKDCRATNYHRLANALIASLDAGRSSKFVRGLPEEPNAQCEALVQLFSNKGCVLFPPRERK